MKNKFIGLILCLSAILSLGLFYIVSKLKIFENGYGVIIMVSLIGACFILTIVGFIMFTKSDDSTTKETQPKIATKQDTP